MRNLGAMSGRKLDYLSALLCSLVALSPLILYGRHFEALFWFGDELDLLLQLKREGLGTWAFKTFGENFVPVFKIIWFLALVVFDGSYFGVITALWVTHAANTALLWFLVRTCGGSRFASTISALTLGASATTLESLGWSVQWSAVMATTFTLIAFVVYPKDGSSTGLKLYFSSLLGAAFSFSRGILASVVGAIFPLLWRGPFRWWIISGLSLVPAVIAVLFISSGATGNHRAILSGDLALLSKMAEFSLYSVSLNPIYHLLRLEEINWNTIAAVGSLKILIIGLGFLAAKRVSANLVKLLFALFLFDLLNCTILGIGRHHTGVQFSVSSRYQYEYLVTLSPFIGLLADAATRWIRNLNFKSSAQCIAAALWIFWIASPWGGEIKEWSRSRGKDGRALLLKQRISDPNADGTKLWWGIPPTISLKDAYEVVDEYGLK